jgi:hypothetical protein
VRLTVNDSDNEAPADSASNQSGLRNFSIPREIFIPLAAALVPMALFRLVGVLAKGFDKPGVEMPMWIAVAMGIVQTLGIVTMAVAVLWRGEQKSKRVMFLSEGHPRLWRSYSLRLSLVCLFLFDIVSNLMAAFGGTGIFIYVAVPSFIKYVIFNLATFAGLKPTERRQSGDNAHRRDVL